MRVIVGLDVQDGAGTLDTGSRRGPDPLRARGLRRLAGGTAFML
jgi:hypothetical protein